MSRKKQDDAPITVPRLTIGPVIGHVRAKQQLCSALTDNKMHHAWRFHGPRGIGKSRLAALFAGAVLSGRANLDIPAEDRTFALMKSGAHPDFMLLDRPFDDKGKQKTEIPVESVRKLSHFFSLRSGLGGWRVAVINSMDELNASSANALLKTLEEPPAKALLILLSHGERPILPTLKSRCRTLKLAPLGSKEALAVMEQQGVSSADAKSLLDLAPGRPGRALAMNDKTVREAAYAIRKAVSVQADAKAVNAAMTNASKNAEAFSASFTILYDAVRHQAMDNNNALLSGEWALLYSDLQTLYAETIGLNMDKSQAIATAVLRFQKTSRAG